MLTLQDCIDLAGIDRDMIDAIVEHEHVPEIVAVELADYLVHCDDAIPRVRRIILDDIEVARRHGDLAKVQRLETAMRHFVEAYTLIRLE